MDPLRFPSSTKPRMSENINPNEPFEVRLFKPSDLNQVTTINLSCLPENYHQAFYHILHYRFPKTFLVATASRKIIGYIMCRIERGFSETQRLKLLKKGHIVSLAVLPNYRGRGVGKALVAKAVKGMKEYDAKESYLEVRVSNQAAINLYKKLEFHTARRKEAYYKDGEDAYIMTKDIA